MTVYINGVAQGGGGVTGVTFVVGANDAIDKTRADYECDGTDDHVQIQAALDALPASGGTVQLLEGTYNIETAIALDSFDRLIGNGRGTILTTTTADLDIITATGGAGTEKVGITIADLTVDGDAGGAVNDNGIQWDYVDFSVIRNVLVQNCGSASGDNGILLTNCDYNKILGSVIRDCNEDNIGLVTSTHNLIESNQSYSATKVGVKLATTSTYNQIVGNNIDANGSYGIYIDGGSADGFNSVVGNQVTNGNNDGILVYQSYTNTITGNLVGFNGNAAHMGIHIWDSDYCQANDNLVVENNDHGIYLQDSDNCIVDGNACLANSQRTDNTYDNIRLHDSDYNQITNNICRQAGSTNQPKYGIHVETVGSTGNVVRGNDLYDSGQTANFLDAGTSTKLASVVIPFVDGTAATATGFDVDAESEYAYAFGSMPADALEVVRIKIRGRAITTDGTNEMLLDIDIFGGSDNEAYNVESYSADDISSDTVPSGNDDIVQWTVTDAGVVGSGGLSAGDSFVVSAIGAPTDSTDLATDCHFQSVLVEYI